MRKLVLVASALIIAITITASSQTQSETSSSNQVASSHAKADAGPMEKGRRSGSIDVVAQNKSSANSEAATLAPVKTRPEVPRKAAPAPNSVSNSAVITVASSQVYRVGIRDVLDITIANNPSTESTLFTVLEGGLIDYPFAGRPIAVAGMTTNEIARMLSQRIKVFDNPKVIVNVRDFASHIVNVSGFVGAPGKKALRREAMPLYAVLAEALVLPEASQATITRQGLQPIVVELKDPNLAATLVLPGDNIKVSGSPPAPIEFFFIGGLIKLPGQKAFHTGLTLTQAILASGGTSGSAASRVRVSRQGADGKLVSEAYNLRTILDGKAADPALRKGDRIEVMKEN